MRVRPCPGPYMVHKDPQGAKPKNSLWKVAAGFLSGRTSPLQPIRLTPPIPSQPIFKDEHLLSEPGEFWVWGLRGLGLHC